MTVAPALVCSRNRPSWRPSPTNARIGQEWPRARRALRGPDPPTDQPLGLVAKDGRHATSGANGCPILGDDHHERPRFGPQCGVLIGGEGSDDFERGNMDLVGRRLPLPTVLRRPPRRNQLGNRPSSASPVRAWGSTSSPSSPGPLDQGVVCLVPHVGASSQSGHCLQSVGSFVLHGRVLLTAEVAGVLTAGH